MTSQTKKFIELSDIVALHLEGPRTLTARRCIEESERLRAPHLPHLSSSKSWSGALSQWSMILSHLLTDSRLSNLWLRNPRS